MPPSNPKQTAPFLLKFALSSALLLALWPPFAWVYGLFLGAAANACFALVLPCVSVEVRDRSCFTYHLLKVGDGVRFTYHLPPNVLQYEVIDYAIYLNVLVLTALFAALPGKPRDRLKALGVTLLALFASHILCLYLLSYIVIWDQFPRLNPAGPAQNIAFRLLVSRVDAALSHQTALICNKAFLHWIAYGWEGLPFLAGALAFGRARGLFREKRRVTRPRLRAAPMTRTSSARTPWRQQPPARWRVPSPLEGRPVRGGL